MWRNVLILQIVLALVGVAPLIAAEQNLTNFLEHRRKRSLIFQSGGTLKFSIGPSMPVFLGDPVSWRSLVCSYTLQGGQYPMPTKPIYPWTKWEENFARTLAEQRQRFDEGGAYIEDLSRLLVYTALDNFMGRDCLLRSICENAQYEYHDVGIVTEIFNVILTPGRERIDAAYKQAHELGKSGVDCHKQYSGCPEGENILERYMYTL